MNAKQFTFDEQLGRLKEAAGVDTDSGLTSILGVRTSGIYNAKVRGKIPHKWFVIISTKYGVNLEWLISGTGARELAQSTQIGFCQQCLELQKQLAIANERLSTANERLYEVGEREKVLLKELVEREKVFAEIKEENAVLKNIQKPSVSCAENAPKDASTASAAKTG